MMRQKVNINLDATEVKLLHGDWLDRFTKELRESSTKSKDVCEEEFKFQYRVSEMVTGALAVDVLAGKRSPPLPDDIESRVAARLTRMRCTLEIKAGRFIRNYYMTELPQRVLEEVKQQEVLRRKELDRIASLTEDERIAEQNQLLIKISKSRRGGLLAGYLRSES